MSFFFLYLLKQLYFQSASKIRFKEFIRILNFLFDFILKKTGTKAKQWIHYGDNERSDYSVPRLKGIKANLIIDTDFTDEEKYVIDVMENELGAGMEIDELIQYSKEHNHMSQEVCDKLMDYFNYITVY